MDPIVASFNVKIVLRAPDGEKAPTVDALEKAVEDGLLDYLETPANLTVNATAERVDNDR